VNALQTLSDKGNTLVVVEHDGTRSGVPTTSSTLGRAPANAAASGRAGECERDLRASANRDRAVSGEPAGAPDQTRRSIAIGAHLVAQAPPPALSPSGAREKSAPAAKRKAGAKANGAGPLPARAGEGWGLRVGFHKPLTITGRT